MNTEMCACGLPLHYTVPANEAYVRGLVRELGECIRMSVIGTDTVYMVPRHFIALHGLKAAELSEVARRYGFKRVEAKNV